MLSFLNVVPLIGPIAIGEFSIVSEVSRKAKVRVN